MFPVIPILESNVLNIFVLWVTRGVFCGSPRCRKHPPINSINHTHMGVSWVMGVPQKWMVFVKGTSHLEMDNGWWLGVPLFMESPISTHLANIRGCPAEYQLMPCHQLIVGIRSTVISWDGPDKHLQFANLKNPPVKKCTIYPYKDFAMFTLFCYVTVYQKAISNGVYTYDII